MVRQKPDEIQEELLLMGIIIIIEEKLILITGTMGGDENKAT